MRSLVSITLLIIYLLTHTGVYSSLHWCGEVLQSAEVMTTEIANCCGGVLQATDDSDDDCCHAELKVWQIDDDQQSEKIPSFSFANAIALLPAAPVAWETLCLQPALLTSVLATPMLARPPTLLKVPIYIKINVLRV